MKRVIFLLIGILILAVACQDNFVEPENDISVVTKSAKFEKTKTHQIKDKVSVISDPEAPMLTCTPAEAEVEMCSRGWISGHENIFGKFDQEHSTYEKEYCEFEMTEVSVSTFNRKLTVESTTFPETADNWHYSMAITRLRNSNLNELSEILGYANISNIIRAFFR